jgi:DNA-binding MarR family transcriptional regulator
MSETRQTGNQSGEKLLVIQDHLFRHFLHGITPGDLARVTGYSPSYISRAIATLEKAGWVERIPETKRLRASIRMARYAVAILKEMEKATQRLSDLQTRIGD